VLKKAANNTLDATNDPDMQQINSLLDSLIKDDLVARVYLLYPNPVVKDGKTVTTFVASDTSLRGSGYGSQADFEIPQIFEDAMNKVLALNTDEVVRTPEYDDGTGVWISTMSRYTDEAGKTIADVSIDFDYSNIGASLSDLLTESILTGAGIALLLLVILVPFIRRQLSPLKDVVATLREASSGDLTVRVDIKRKDEFGMLSEDLNQMLVSIGELVNKVKTDATNVSLSSTDMRDNITKNLESIEAISVSMQHISNITTDQTTSIEETKRAMNEMAIGVQKIAGSSSDVAAYIEDASSQTNQGTSLMAVAVASINEIGSSSLTVQEKLDALVEHSNQIGKILAVIKEIAGRTNLLSLNASIEAARAGEHGRGFAVVASEINALAAQSKASSEEINDIITMTQTEIQNVVSVTMQNVEKIEKSMTIIQQTSEAISHVDGNMQNINLQMQEVSAATQQLSASSEEVLATVDELAEFSQTVSSQAKGVSDTLTSHTSVSKDTLQKGNENMQTAEVLVNNTKIFKV